MRIALVGYMGSGKSTIAKLLSERMSIPFIDLDELIEKREGKTIAALFSEKGEAYFRQLESDALREILAQNRPFILATGGGTPCFLDHMRQLNERCHTVYLRCSAQMIQMRIAHTAETRPLLYQNIGEIEKHLLEREMTYSQAHFIVSGELPPSELVGIIAGNFS